MMQRPRHWRARWGWAILLLPVWGASAAAQMEPGAIGFLSQLAQEQLDAGQNAYAMETFQKLLLVDPGNQHAKSALTRLQVAQLAREYAMEEALNRLAHHPSSPQPAQSVTEAGTAPEEGGRRVNPESEARGAWSLTSFNLSSGYRVDDFDWNIAGDMNGDNPNVLSELTWRDLEMYEVAGEATLDLPHAYVRAEAKKAWIVDGTNQDSDYLGDDRTFEFSRSNNSTDDRSAMDLSIGAGLPLRVWEEELTIIPLGGVSYHELKLKITDGVQTIPNTGPFSGLNSTYESFWLGPWVGVDVVYAASPRWRLFASAEMHWADYSARADWNLRTDFQHPKSFKHDAEATGFITGGRLDYALNRDWALRASVGYALWSTHPGHDRTFNSDGTTSDTRLNEVNWESLNLLLGITARF